MMDEKTEEEKFYVYKMSGNYYTENKLPVPKKVLFEGTEKECYEFVKHEMENPKPFSESWNELTDEVKITCKQSAEALEERLFLVQLQQSSSTYLVCFDNGYAYHNVSALELYNFLKLKMQYNTICKQRDEYVKSLCNPYSTIIGSENIKKLKIYNLSLQPQIDAIIKVAQLFTMPFNREIEKIIDETTNQAVKL